MQPTLKDGQIVLVSHRSEPHEGSVVVAIPAALGQPIIKRVTKIEADGYWLEGDAHNPATAATSQDSWVFGAVPREAITATVIFPRI